jgi:hypothetical protein
MACHQEEMRATAQVNRRLAIQQGLCTNYWKCHNPAAPDGKMCQTCYEEYRQKHQNQAPAPAGSQRQRQRPTLAIKRPQAQPTKTDEVDEAEEPVAEEAVTEEAGSQ